ncbi:MAG: winged helix-turn-helix domain-containing protein [Chloroflexota bacterium]|nr:winged helix-turn-helix domain-containing protein [Chloroflexota bacterium]
MTDLAGRLGVPLTTLHRVAQRLIEADLLRGRTVGRARLLQANADHRATAALTRLLEVTFGPHTVVEDEFAGLVGVVRVLIFGSWAARYHGSYGPAPGTQANPITKDDVITKCVRNCDEHTRAQEVADRVLGLAKEDSLSAVLDVAAEIVETDHTSTGTGVRRAEDG